MLADGTVISGRGGKLTAAVAAADHALHDILMNVQNGDAAVGAAGASVTLRSRNGEHYVAHVLPLTSGARRKASITYSAVAALFVHKATMDLPHPLETIATTFKLTPAEMRNFGLSPAHDAPRIARMSSAEMTNLF